MPLLIAERTVSGVMPCSLLYASCNVAAAIRLANGPLHRIGHAVGVQDHLGVDVAGGPADRLNQRRLAAQEAFLVRVENRHQRHLRQIEPLAQQVDADQHVERPFAQFAQNLHALDGVQFRVQPFAAQAGIAEDSGVRSSAMRLVSVVTSTRSFVSARFLISSTRSGTWPRAGRMCSSGSTSPVGRITCSTTSPPHASSS